MKTVMLFLFLLVSALSVSAINERNYQSVYSRQVRRWVERVSTTGTLKTPDGRLLHWMSVVAPKERGAVVIVQGWDEQMALYDEFLNDLRNSGYSFYLFDLRGQGLSQGDYPSTDRWYVTDWRSFESDLDLFSNTVVRAKPHTQTIFYGNSMGGAIATVCLAEHPHAADRLLLLAPMYRINTSPFPLIAMRLVAGFMNLIGRGTSYLPGYGPYKEHAFEGNPEYITSKVR